MVAENIMPGERPPLESCAHDSRHVKVVSVLEEIIRCAERSPTDGVERGLQRLLNNSLEQAHEENSHMQAICYPESAEHELDHFRICTTIAGLCCRWSRSRDSLNDLQELRALVS